MKYIKKYEKKDLDLQVGDYLLVKTVDNRINNEVVKVTEVPHSKYYFMAIIPDYVGDYAIYYSEIIKKLSDDEVEMYKKIDDYNL